MRWRWNTGSRPGLMRKIRQVWRESRLGTSARAQEGNSAGDTIADKRQMKCK